MLGFVPGQPRRVVAEVDRGHKEARNRHGAKL
jgi:hypothetical protein